MEKIAGICSGMAVKIRSPGPPEYHLPRAPASDENCRTGAQSEGKCTIWVKTHTATPAFREIVQGPLLDNKSPANRLWIIVS